MECGRHAPFTCAAECGKLNNDMRDAVKLPTNVSCPAQPGPAPPKWHFAPGQVSLVDLLCPRSCPCPPNFRSWAK